MYTVRTLWWIKALKTARFGSKPISPAASHISGSSSVPGEASMTAVADLSSRDMFW